MLIDATTSGGMEGLPIIAICSWSFTLPVANKMKLKIFRKKYAKRERTELDKCWDLLKLTNIFAYRNNTGVAKYKNKDGSIRHVSYSFPGAPDICGFVPKAFKSEDYPEFHAALPFYYEVKRNKEIIPRPNQRAFLETAKKAGCFADYGDSEKLEKLLKENGWL